MEQEITANGTVAFWLRPGRHVMSFTGTPDTSTVVALKGGNDSAGSDHVAITNKAGTAIQIASQTLPEPQEVRGGGYLSLVTTDYDSSTGLKAVFRYAGQ